MTANGNGGALVPTAQWTQEQVDLIKRTCVPSGEAPPNDAFAVFLHVCKQTGLDPMLREAWLISRRAKDARGNWVNTWQTMAGRDGYLAAAHRTGELRGITTRVYPEDASKPPTHATCIVHRAGWTAPVEVTVAFREYASQGPLWQGKPRTMIAKVAESHALRRAFSLHGTYSPEELPDDAPPAQSVHELARVHESVNAPQQTPAQISEGQSNEAENYAATPEAWKDEPEARQKRLARKAEGRALDAVARDVAQARDIGIRQPTARAAFARWGKLDAGGDDAFKLLCEQSTGKPADKVSRKSYTRDDWAAVHRSLDNLERDADPTPPDADDDVPPNDGSEIPF